MTKSVLIYLFLSLWITAAFSQGSSRQEANSMLNELDKSKADLERVDLILTLAQFRIFKPGEFQIDFDSAMVYINEVKALNHVSKSPDADSLVHALARSKSDLHRIDLLLKAQACLMRSRDPLIERTLTRGPIEAHIGRRRHLKIY